MSGERFTIDDEHIVDNEYEVEPIYIETYTEAKNVCWVLNKLHNKNEELEQELHKIKLVNEMLSMDFANSEHELWKENEELKQQLNRLYNYFEDWHKYDMEASGFSEMWDAVKNSEKYGPKKHNIISRFKSN